MQCPRCHAENREGRRFCGECGLSLVLACASCGFVNEGSEKFCGGCGAPTACATPTPEGRFGPPESYIPRHLAEKILTSKAAPLAHEDHAVRACYAALRMQESVKRYAESVLRSHGITIRIRVGLNSGERVVRAIGNDLHMDYTAVGQTTHRAARMEQLADPRSVLLTAMTENGV